MNTHFVLYDQRGQVQRVALAEDMVQAQRYLDAGFVPVSESEYNRAALLVPLATLDDLALIAAASGVLRQIQQQERQLATMRDVDAKQLEKLIVRLQRDYRQIATAFTNGETTIEQWYRQMVDLSNRANIAAAALAVGGVDRLSRNEVQQIERANAAQTSYLNRFKREAPTLSAAMLIARALLYAGGIRGLFWLISTRALGMPALPAYPSVRTSCRVHCKCWWDIQTLAGNGNWDCYWRLGQAEHCNECLQRQAVFKPLKIRNGIIQPFNPAGIYTRE